MKNSCITVVIISLSLTTYLYAQERLSYDFKQGESFTIHQIAEQEITQGSSGSELKMTSNIHGSMLFTITEKKRDTFFIDMQFINLTMSASTDTAGLIMKIDAKDTLSNSIENKIFSALLHKTFKMSVLPSGKITAVTGFEDFIASFFNKVEDIDAGMKQIIQEKLANSYGPKSLAESFEQMIYYLPEENIQVKENITWKNQYTGRLSATNYWELTDLDAQDWKITGKANTLALTNENGVSMRLNGTQEYVIKGNKTSWLFEELIVSQKAQGYSILAQLGDQQIPTTINSTITYKRTK